MYDRSGAPLNCAAISQSSISIPAVGLEHLEMMGAAEDREVRDHQRLIVGVITFNEILGLTSYALRLLARRLSNNKSWYDDYVMSIGLVGYRSQLAIFPLNLSFTKPSGPRLRLPASATT